METISSFGVDQPLRVVTQYYVSEDGPTLFSIMLFGIMPFGLNPFGIKAIWHKSHLAYGPFGITKMMDIPTNKAVLCFMLNGIMSNGQMSQ